MKQIGKTLAPRLPEAARKKLQSCAKHKNKKAYKRKAKHRDRDKSPVVSLGSCLIVRFNYNLIDMQHHELPAEETINSNIESTEVSNTEDGGTTLMVESVQAAAMRITGEANNDMGRLTQLQELFTQHFGNRFEKIIRFNKDLPGGISFAVNETSPDALKVEIGHAGESKHFLIYQNGKVEGGIPKSWKFSKADLLETIITAVDTYGDNFFRDDSPEEVVAEDIGLEPFLLEGEVVPPEHTGALPPRTGEGGVELRPEDPKRLDFYKKLPGVLCTFLGTINTRGKAFGSQGIPYRVYVFPKHIVLDCTEVGNAIFVRELDEPLNFNMEHLNFPLEERLTEAERQRFKTEIWDPNYKGKHKGDLHQLGFNRIYHPQQERAKYDYFKTYFSKLDQHINFSAYTPRETRSANTSILHG